MKKYLLVLCLALVMGTVIEKEIPMAVTKDVPAWARKGGGGNGLGTASAKAGRKAGNGMGTAAGKVSRNTALGAGRGKVGGLGTGGGRVGGLGSGSGSAGAEQVSLLDNLLAGMAGVAGGVYGNMSEGNGLGEGDAEAGPDMNIYKKKTLPYPGMLPPPEEPQYGFGSRYGGNWGRGGRGGGGYSGYSQLPAWYLNLVNWNIR